MSSRVHHAMSANEGKRSMSTGMTCSRREPISDGARTERHQHECKCSTSERHRKPHRPCNVQDPAVTVIVSVSPQSRASLAARHGLTPGQAQRKLATLFRGLGAAHVLDLGLARDMALLETAAEFVARYRARAEAAQRLSAGAHTLTWSSHPICQCGHCVLGPQKTLAVLCIAWHGC